MAQITKAQIKARLDKINDKLLELKEELETLNIEIEEEKDNIEPYEGKDDLTPSQEQRQETLEEVWTTLDSAKDNLENALSDMDEGMGYLY